MSQPALLEIEELSKRRFKVDGQAHDVLDRVQLEIEPGEIVALIGSSGVGKSTLLRLLNRLEEPDSGQILFCGQSIAQVDPLGLRRQVGLVTQKPFMFPGTVRDNLLIAFSARADEIPGEEEFYNILETSSVDSGWLDQPAHKLSVGQQQRVSLARTLMNRPRLLLLDEPTSSLDPETAEAVLTRLVDYIVEAGSSLILVSHDHRLAKKHAGRILLLRDGHLVEGDKEGNHA